jgi:hypothetical protein
MKRSRKTANKEVAFYETIFAAVGVWVDSIDICFARRQKAFLIAALHIVVNIVVSPTYST